MCVLTTCAVVRTGRTAAAYGPRQVAPSATFKPLDVRSGDATRRCVGLGRSDQRLAVGRPAAWEHPYPARGEFAVRDSSEVTLQVAV